MWKLKYDWSSLKLEFFQSDIDEVKEFFQRKYNVYNRNIQQNTKGWTKEKQLYKTDILQRALERKAKEEAKNLEIPVGQLKMAKKTVIWLLMKRLQKIIEDEDSDININELERILKMTKTELWEPTNISKNDTTLRWEPLDESLFIQD